MLPNKHKERNATDHALVLIRYCFQPKADVCVTNYTIHYANHEMQKQMLILCHP